MKPWEGDKHFEQFISGGRTLLDKDRLWTIYSLGRSLVYRVEEGDIAEFGVYKGGCLKLLSQIFTNERIFAFDTFKGIPFSSSDDNYHQKGDFHDTDIESVKMFVNSENVRYMPGIFSEFLEYDDKHEFKFVHVDCDVYNSVIEACLYFTPRMVPGGIIVFDDYGSPTCLGVRKAINSFYGKRSVKLTTGQAIYIA